MDKSDEILSRLLKFFLWSHLQSIVKSANYAFRQQPQTAGARWDSVTHKRQQQGPGAEDTQVKTHTCGSDHVGAKQSPQVVLRRRKKVGKMIATWLVLAGA